MAPPRSHARFPLFDSLRGLAAISILFVDVGIFTDAFGDTWHGRLVAHLDIGVPFFFLLSAFLLYRPFVAARVRNVGRPAFGGYARRRFLRIAPAYWAVLTIAAIVPGMAGAFTGNWWSTTGCFRTTRSTRPMAPAPWTGSLRDPSHLEPRDRGLLLRPAALIRAADGVDRLQVAGRLAGPRGDRPGDPVGRVVRDPEPRPLLGRRAVPLLLADRPWLVVALGLGLAAFSVGSSSAHANHDSSAGSSAIRRSRWSPPPRCIWACPS